jgi:hypothetical protein
MNFQTPTCYVCKAAQVNLSDKLRSNGYLTGTCSDETCKWLHSYWVINNNTLSLSWISRRFSNKNTVWHMTYRPDLNQTTFTKVEKRIQGEATPARETYAYPSLVKPERFINLIVFL